MYNPMTYFLQYLKKPINWVYVISFLLLIESITLAYIKVILNTRGSYSIFLIVSFIIVLFISVQPYYLSLNKYPKTQFDILCYLIGLGIYFILLVYTFAHIMTNSYLLLVFIGLMTYTFLLCITFGLLGKYTSIRIKNSNKKKREKENSFKKKFKQFFSFGHGINKNVCFIKTHSYNLCPPIIQYLLILSMINDKRILGLLLFISLKLDSGFSYCVLVILFHLGGVLVAVPSLREKYIKMYGPNVFKWIGWNPGEVPIARSGKAGVVLGVGYSVYVFGVPITDGLINMTTDRVKHIQWIHSCAISDSIRVIDPVPDKETKYPYPPKPPISNSNVRGDINNFLKTIGFEGKVTVDVPKKGQSVGKAAIKAWGGKKKD